MSTVNLRATLEAKTSKVLYKLVLLVLFAVTENWAESSRGRRFSFPAVLESPDRLKAFKRSLTADPFDKWFFKSRFKSLVDISLTPDLYIKDVVERPVTKDRLKNIMRRALRGQHVNVVVMGGSISAGGGFSVDYESIEGIYYRLFIDWWQKAVEPFTGSKAELDNLAVGGTSSNFFAFCYKNLLKPENAIDLTFLEFTVNDYVMFQKSSHPMSLSIEQLTREIMRQRNSSAIMFVNFVQGNGFKVPVCDNLENHGQTALAWHYAITSFSVRSSLCPNLENAKFPAMFSSDGNHVSIIAHAQIGLMIINNVRHALLELIDDFERGSFNVQAPGSLEEDLPRPLFATNTQVEYKTPLCCTQITPDVTRGMTEPSLSVMVVGNTGFEPIQNIPIGVQQRVGSSRTDGYGGWKAGTINSLLKLRIDLPFDGFSDGGATRTIVIAVRTSGYGGSARVLVEKYTQQEILVDTRSSFGQTRLVHIAHHVNPGSHLIYVRIVRSGPFILCGVMAVDESLHM